MKKSLTIIFTLLIITLFLTFTSAVHAASTATVTATVTVQNVSVSVSDGSVAFGTLSTSSSAGTNSADTQTATNNGNITENLNIKGQNTGSWTLGASAGTDQYVLRFCTATCGSPTTNYTALTTSYQTLASSVAASGTQTFDLYLTTPSSSTVFTEQTVTVTVQAVAP